MAVQRQVEYYFSDENLAKDTFLRGKMDTDGFIGSEVISSFKRVATMLSTVPADQRPAFVTESLTDSLLVEVVDGRLRRRPGSASAPASPSRDSASAAAGSVVAASSSSTHFSADAPAFVPGRPFDPSAIPFAPATGLWGQPSIPIPGNSYSAPFVPPPWVPAPGLAKGASRSGTSASTSTSAGPTLGTESSATPVPTLVAPASRTAMKVTPPRQLTDSGEWTTISRKPKARTDEKASVLTARAFVCACVCVRV